MWAHVNANAASELDTYLQLKASRIQQMFKDYCDSTLRLYQLEGGEVARLRSEISDRLLHSNQVADSVFRQARDIAGRRTTLFGQAGLTAMLLD